MLRHGFFTVVVLVLLPATVQAFDHHHHFHHESSSGDGGCGSSSSASVPVAPPASPTPKRIFVTSTTYAGDFGGVAAADAQCQIHASDAGLDGTFKAWLSAGGENAYDRNADAGPWYTTGDQLAFPAKSDFRATPKATLLDEYGGYGARTGTAGAWSGSDAAGEATSQNCGGWVRATADSTATTGTAFELDTTWGGGNAPLGCDERLPLICVQQ